MKKLYLLLSLLLLVLFADVSAAKEEKPLPAPLFAAKTVYIDNQTGSAKTAEAASQALRKWGRYQIVTDHQQADLVFRFTTKQQTGALMNPGSTRTSVGPHGQVSTSHTTPSMTSVTFC